MPNLTHLQMALELIPVHVVDTNDIDSLVDAPHSFFTQRTWDPASQKDPASAYDVHMMVVQEATSSIFAKPPSNMPAKRRVHGAVRFTKYHPPPFPPSPP